MKTTKIIAGGMGLLASMSTMAIGYGSVSDTPAGTRTSELHAIQFKTELADCSASAFCSGDSSIGSDFVTIVELANQTTCTGPIGTCVAVNVADTYTGTNAGGATSGATPTALYTNIHLPECDQVNDPNCGRDLPLTSTFLDWNFITQPGGKIDSGYIIADAAFGTSGTVGVFNFDSMIFRSYRGPFSQLNVACATNPAADYTTCWTDIPSTPADGPSSEQHFDYVTVPMDLADLTKAVPVPAFAAAALGLGLVAITVLTGRRRQIK